MRKIINKKLKATLVGISLLLGLSGCGKTPSKSTEATTVPSTVVTTELETETETELETEEEIEKIETIDYSNAELDINDNFSIDAVATRSYEEYKEFYEQFGYSKNDIVDLILILNDKYTDEDDKLVVDDNKVSLAYDMIETITGEQYDFLNIKMQVINSVNMDPVVSEQFSEYLDNKVKRMPKLTELVDKNNGVSKVAFDELKEYEDFRDSVIKTMNDTNNYDKDVINNYVIKQERLDIIDDQDGLNYVDRKDGLAVALLSCRIESLALASMANPTKEFLPAYDNIDEGIKINFTEEESTLENEVIHLLKSGVLDPQMTNDVINYYAKEFKISDKKIEEVLGEDGIYYTEEEKEMLDKFSQNSDYQRMIISYANVRARMANQDYIDTKCSKKNEIYKNIEAVREKTSSYNDSKKLVLNI